MTEQDKQRVADSFNAVMSELNRITDDTKMACANAAMDGDFDKMDATKFSALLLKDFANEVIALSSLWDKGIFNAPVAEKIQVTTDFNSVRKKKPPTRLRVTFTALNKSIQCRTAAETFAESLRLLKFERVATMNKHANGYPLVSKTEFHPDVNRSIKSGDWYINFPSNTQSKKTYLEEISAALKIAIRVDVV